VRRSCSSPPQLPRSQSAQLRAAWRPARRRVPARDCAEIRGGGPGAARLWRERHRAADVLRGKRWLDEVCLALLRLLLFDPRRSRGRARDFSRRARTRSSSPSTTGATPRAAYTASSTSPGRFAAPPGRDSRETPRNSTERRSPKCWRASQIPHFWPMDPRSRSSVRRGFRPAGKAGARGCIAPRGRAVRAGFRRARGLGGSPRKRPARRPYPGGARRLPAERRRRGPAG